MAERWRHEPVVTLTTDQDWAPAWASAALLDLCTERNLPLHAFRTNPCPALDAAAASGAITQGWHPNFLPGSSHGSTPDEVVAWCAASFPGTRTARSHAYAESTAAWTALRDAGIVADSQVCTRWQVGLTPLLHWTGIVRLPVFFEDDVFFTMSPDLDLGPVLTALRQPGLKVLDVHATFFATNCPSPAHYAEHRDAVFGSSTAPFAAVHSGRGSATVLVELLDALDQAGIAVEPFETVVDECLAAIAPTALRRTP